MGSTTNLNINSSLIGLTFTGFVPIPPGEDVAVQHLWQSLQVVRSSRKPPPSPPVAHLTPKKPWDVQFGKGKTSDANLPIFWAFLCEVLGGVCRIHVQKPEKKGYAVLFFWYQAILMPFSTSSSSVCWDSTDLDQKKPSPGAYQESSPPMSAHPWQTRDWHHL